MSSWTPIPVDIDVAGGISVSQAVVPESAKGNLWARFSIPLPADLGGVPEHLSIADANGERVALQHRTLASWDDGSPRWLDCQAVAPTPGRYHVVANEGRCLSSPVTVEEVEGKVVIANADLSVSISPHGPSPIQQIHYRGHLVSHGSHAFEAAVATKKGTFNSHSETERTIDIRQRGPVRGIVDIHGVHLDGDGRRSMRYRLRVELIAGFPVLILRHTFVHDDPGTIWHDLHAAHVKLRWQVPAQPTRHLHQRRYGILSVPRDVQTHEPVDIRAVTEHAKVHVHNMSCLADDTVYPDFACGPMNDSVPAVGHQLVHGAVMLVADEFREKCPTGLYADGDYLRLDMWPHWASPAEMHQGWSPEHTMRLVFSEDESIPFAAARQLADSTGANGVTRLATEYYRHAKFGFMDRVVEASRDDCPRFNKYLSKLATVPTVIGMWDLGDTPDPGYQSTYSSIGRLKSYTREIPPRFAAGLHAAQVPWSNPEQFEQVWANNEYDVIVCLNREWMRGGGNEELWRRLRWFARHAAEVDFLDYSDYPEQHHGSPAHSARHCSASAYPSHMWTEGLVGYYCLSGDEDVLAAAVKQADYIISVFNDPPRRAKLWKFTRELGWALLALASAADVTREQRFIDAATELSTFFRQQELHDELLVSMVRYSFGYASIALGMEAIYQVTADEEDAKWLVELADGVGKVLSWQPPVPTFNMTLNYLNAAYDIDRDPKHIRAGMRIVEELVDSKAWYEPSLFTKPVAMIYRGLSRFVQSATELGYLKQAGLERPSWDEMS